MSSSLFINSLAHAAKVILKVFSFASVIITLAYFAQIIYNLGHSVGYQEALAISRQSPPTAIPTPNTLSTLTPTPVNRSRSITPTTLFSGPELWEAINSSRTQNGVNPLKSLDIFCTVASIRLNQQLSLGTLDNHTGFESTLKQVPATEKYNVAEFLVYTKGTANDAVNLWLNTLGHRQLLTGGEYIYGCSYAQNGFGVAIAAY